MAEKPAVSYKYALSAALISIFGIIDVAFLSVYRVKNEVVPCSIISGCESVLSSSYSKIAGFPLEVFGGAAYLIIFILALLTVFGKAQAWFFLGVQVVLMTAFTVWLVYLQAFVIEAFCQYCLISAALTLTLFLIALISRFWRFR
ncbi:MAG TPA: vitamin K epoxide reductase family protein [Pyrinomonadaceae bacterium]|jgi:uncharacterized membrane protein